MNTFKIGDKVRLINNEINAAEHILAIGKTLTVYDVHKTLLSVKTINDDENIGIYLVLHYSRFEIVQEQLKYDVGDFVELKSSNEDQALITDKQDEVYTVMLANGGHIFYITECDIMRKISPFDIVLDFSNVVKGTIRKSKFLPYHFYINTLEAENEEKGIWLTPIPLEILDQPMKSMVKNLLDAQETERYVKIDVGGELRTKSLAKKVM